MKKRLLWICLGVLCTVILCGCSAAPADEPLLSGRMGEINWDLPPTLVLNGRQYHAPHMPVSELPDGYKYAGVLSDEAANNTGLNGHDYYVADDSETPLDLYVYQECGTPISEDTVDTTKRQWAYVQWILSE